MASYIDTVNALNPVFFGVGLELAGPTIVDLSGNGNNGTYNAAAVFGLPSPIETNPSIFSVGNHVGAVPATLGSQMDLVGNQTWIGWMYYDDALAATMHMLSRVNQFGQSNGIVSGINGGVITSHLTLDTGGLGTFYTLTDPVSPVVGNFYMVSTVRNSTTLNLYTNDRLAATRSDLTTDDTIGAGLQWNIGSAPFAGVRTCMIALFDYALNQAQIIEIYEAALNSLFLNGYSNVIPTAILYNDFEDPPTSFPFRHNWSDPLIERISFRTNITKTRSGAEEAGQVRPMPRREIEISQILRDNADRRKLRAQLWAHQDKKWFVPILEDRDRLSSPLTAGATSIPVSTAYKDYKVGGYLGLRQLNDNGTVSHSENLLISAVNANSVDVEAITNAYEALRSEAYPVRRAKLPNSIQLRGHTSRVETATIVAELFPQDEEIQPNRITPYIPLIKYRDYEVFDGSVWQANDWSELREYDVDRDQKDVDFDSGIFTPESDTPGAAESFSYRMAIQGRANNAAFLGWFYERAGSLNYVWVPTMQEDFEILSNGAADITVEGTNYSDNYALAESRRDLAFVYNDLSMEFRRVTGFSGTTNETLTLGANVPSLTNLKFVCLLKFCRLDADVLEIAKHTDDVWKYAWGFRELLESPPGTGLSSLSPSASVSRSGSPSASISPSASVSPSISPSLSPSPSLSLSPSASQSPSASVSRSVSPSASVSPSSSQSPSASVSPS